MFRFASSISFFPVLWTRTKRLLKRFPLQSLSVLLFLFLIVLVIGRFLSSSQPATPEDVPEKSVATFSVGTVARIPVRGVVEKSGVLTIQAQTAGIVSDIPVSVGSHVSRGTRLVSLASSYSLGNALSVQKSLALAQYRHILDTFDEQKEIISKQREITEKSHDGAGEMRDILESSLGDTRALISLNEDILSSLDQTLEALESANTSGENDALILSTKQMKSQVLTALSQAKSGLRTAEYQSSDEKIPAGIVSAQKDATLLQISLQEKALILSRELSRLQYKLAKINESLMFPSSPFDATIERIHVSFGEQVSPGTALVTLSGDTTSSVVQAFVTSSLVRRVSKTDLADVHLPDTSFSIAPFYVSREAVSGQLHSVLFRIPDAYERSVSDGMSVSLDIPIGYADTMQSFPFVPIDAIFLDSDSASLFVLSHDRAEVRRVTLGSLLGSFVEIRSGIDDVTEVILDRSVLDGERVKKHVPLVP